LINPLVAVDGSKTVLKGLPKKSMIEILSPAIGFRETMHEIVFMHCNGKLQRGRNCRIIHITGVFPGKLVASLGAPTGVLQLASALLFPVIMPSSGIGRPEPAS
jgi:hypothetical protein